ncbi:MAG: hypothetical protein LBF37_03170, partial [Rickettsiales bacterium]|nr:hypothetical protein [Rickettsiales bacterium]
MFKSIGVSLAVFGTFMVLGTADAAEGRAGYNVNYVNANNRAGMVSGQQRMPTMPTLPGNSIGKISPSIPNGGGDNPYPGCTPGTACTCSNGASGVYRPNCTCDCSTTPPITGCPDGGVKDSDYTVESCMNDVLA